MKVVREKDREEMMPELETLVNLWFWQRKKQECLLPSKDLFLKQVPADIMEYNIVAKIQLEPFKVFYESAGHTLEVLYGRTLAGKNLDQLYNFWFRSLALNGYKKAIQERMPVYNSSSVATITKPVGYSKILLPVMDLDFQLYVLIFIFPQDASIKKYQDWHALVEATPWLAESTPDTNP